MTTSIETRAAEVLLSYLSIDTLIELYVLLSYLSIDTLIGMRAPLSYLPSDAVPELLALLEETLVDRDEST